MTARDRFLSASKTLAKRILRKTWYRPDVVHLSETEKPFLLRLDINNTCNLLCRKCFYPDFARGNPAAHYMSLEDFQILASRLFPSTYCLQLACGFEAMMHPRFVEILRETDRYDLPHVGMVTNGVLLTGDKRDAILRSRNMKIVSVSLDAIEPETFAFLRGRSLLDVVLKNVEAFGELRRAEGREFPILKINTRLMRSSLRELPRLLQWCVERSIQDVYLFHVMPVSLENEESLLHAPEEYNAMREELLALARKASIRLEIPPPLTPEYRDAETGEYSLLPRLDESERRNGPGENKHGGDPARPLPFPYPRDVFCICPWMVLMVNCFGELTPCSHRYDYFYGNILRQEPHEALNSIRILKLRRAIRLGRREGKCEGCTAILPYSDPLTARLPDIVF